MNKKDMYYAYGYGGHTLTDVKSTRLNLVEKKLQTICDEGSHEGVRFRYIIKFLKAGSNTLSKVKTFNVISNGVSKEEWIKLGCPILVEKAMIQAIKRNRTHKGGK